MKFKSFYFTTNTDKFCFGVISFLKCYYIIQLRPDNSDRLLAVPLSDAAIPGPFVSKPLEILEEDTKSSVVPLGASEYAPVPSTTSPHFTCIGKPNGKYAEHPCTSSFVYCLNRMLNSDNAQN